MRLKPDEIDHIIHELGLFIGSHQAELRLYGSRVHDERRGGDIDLLLLTNTLSLANHIMEKKHYLLANIKKNIGDQKIDLLIIDNESAKQDLFLSMILPESVCLKKWL
jgi:hypothetical protein